MLGAYARAFENAGIAQGRFERFYQAVKITKRHAGWTGKFIALNG